MNLAYTSTVLKTFTRASTQAEVSIRDVASQLQQSSHHVVTVVDREKVPIGGVTQTDMMQHIEQGRDLDPTQSIDAFMKQDMVKISEEKTVNDALALMNLLEVNKLIVTRADSTFRGILHKFDIIRKAQELL